ncbi:MAG: multiple antibiotic resistance (MarC)-related protein [Bacteroidetes bacterium]|nr:multiple antibiotic resistance (MarC)-related protein [Bacteroidota bacterium]
MALNLNIQEIITSFMVLFAVIDITGSVPIIINLNNDGKKVQASKAALLSLIILIAFLFAGEALLKLFNTDIASFAIAGSLVLFALAIEMTFNYEIFRNDAPKGYSTIVPVVFPLIAGAGTLTTTLSLRSEYSIANIIIAIVINMLLVYFVIKKVNLVEKIFGKGGIYILRKFFGIILLAMSVKLFVSNLSILLLQFK